ncbi:CbiA domain-containing protein [Vibrio owensii]|uniref:CbiA domain-containing protein n=1 Tax=Vibrio owensii TaxID=696485 RepID=A0AAU9Q5T1_9VIBR|nr:CbiA domain-containing protein [Vibrio owensii]
MYNKQQDKISLHYSKAKKVLVMNQKGGVGKSTCAAALLSHLSHLGYKVELIDFDRQCLCHDWAKNALPGCSQSYPPSLRSFSNIAMTLKVRRESDFIVIDSPSNFSQEEMVRYTYFTNAILLPMSPSPLDLHTSLPFIQDLIESGVLSARKIALAFVVNRCVTHDGRVARTEQLLQHFRQYPTLGQVSENVLYQEAFFDKQALPVTLDLQLWRRVIEWLEGL